MTKATVRFPFIEKRFLS